MVSIDIKTNHKKQRGKVAASTNLTPQRCCQLRWIVSRTCQSNSQRNDIGDYDGENLDAILGKDTGLRDPICIL